MHGMDDPFYVDRYQAQFWAFDDGKTYRQPNIDHPLNENVSLPFRQAKLFAFKHMKETEGAILLERSPNLLLTCDAVQSYLNPPHTPHTNFITRLLMPLIGFPKKTLIGPMWMKFLVTDRDGMKAEFERLLKFEFEQLLAAHGTFLTENAHAEVKKAFDNMFA